MSPYRRLVSLLAGSLLAGSLLAGAPLAAAQAQATKASAARPAPMAALATGPSLEHTIDVPPRFRSGLARPGFDWRTSDIARYIEGYERMWQTCVAMGARHIDAIDQCPMFCSGTPAAAAGCDDGAAAIHQRLAFDIRRFGKQRVQSFLRRSLGVQGPP